jgi:hypothetical protein
MLEDLPPFLQVTTVPLAEVDEVMLRGEVAVVNERIAGCRAVFNLDTRAICCT